MDYTVHGILQARILEWVASPFSKGSSQPRDGTQVSHTAGRFFTSWARWILYQLSYQGSPRIIEETLKILMQDDSPGDSGEKFSHVRLFVTPWTVARQASLSMGFPREEYWSELPCPSPGIFRTQGSNPGLSHHRQILYCLSYQESPKRAGFGNFVCLGSCSMWDLRSPTRDPSNTES